MACSQMSRETAIEGAKVLLGCYRTGEANDPEVYAKSVVAVLAEYPVDVIHAVCDPRYGIASKLKWLPTIAELKEACEVAMGPIYFEMARRKQLEDRERILSGASNHVRPSLEELKEKHGPNWGLKTIDDATKQRSQKTLEVMCAEAGITIDEFEAINAEGEKWQKMRQTPKGR